MTEMIETLARYGCRLLFASVLRRAQERILRNDDTRPLFLQYFPLEEVAQSIHRIPTTGSFGQLSVPE
jgi:hypothetical protein